jgi:hypothetical protein
MKKRIAPRQLVVGALLTIYIVLLVFIISRQTGQPTATREILCIGIIENADNAARLDPRVVELCGDVGVKP